MRRPLIAGNWKMNGSLASGSALLAAIVEGSRGFSSIDLAVFPPYVYLAMAGQAIKGTKIALGAQNVSNKEPGALTGEVSATMLVDVACQYVIVGHSERRTLLGETDEIVAEKFNMALQHGVIPILCVGETREAYEAGLTNRVVSRQIQAVISTLSKPVDFVVAYEPVWAIGSGVTPTPEQAQAIHEEIRGQITQNAHLDAQKIRILYGGSVKPDNAELFLDRPDIDGVLVGGASLDAASFLTIGHKAER